MYGATTALTEQDLLLELERVEQAIARSTTFIRWVDTAGRSQVRIAEDLLTLAEREHAIVAAPSLGIHGTLSCGGVVRLIARRR